MRLRSGQTIDVFTVIALCALVAGICDWAEANIEQVQAARETYVLASASGTD